MSELHRTPPRRVAALIAVALTLGAGAAVAERASAAAISAQETVKAGSRMPVDVPGGFRRGSRVPPRHVLLRRRIRLAPDESRRVSFTCPRRTHAINPALNDPSELGFFVDPREYRDRDGRRLRMTVFPRPTGGVGAEATGRAYVMCGPRRSRRS